VTLEEKWRFPPAGADQEIGVIHATPVVVGSYVYFGTATDPTFYKLAPDGSLCWSYKNPAHKSAFSFLDSLQTKDAARKRRFQSSGEGILGSSLVTAESVYFGDLAGWFYALDRATGKVQWTINSRLEPFPGAHGLNSFFASPILADGKLIVAGGTLEQVVAALPIYSGCQGRGWVMALEPASGRILWKFDIGPRPEPLDHNHRLVGEASVFLRAGNEFRLEHAVVR
jgi:outer membrane protein assembly factor BamB